MGECIEAEEELRAIGSWTSVGHGKDSWAGVLVFEVLISKLGTIDRFSASSIAFCEVATLSHETWNDSVEDAALEVEGLARSTNSLFSSAKSSEVLSCFRDYILEKLKNNLICLSSKLYFKKNSRVGLDLAFLYYRVDLYLDLFFFDRFRFRFRFRVRF